MDCRLLPATTTHRPRTGRQCSHALTANFTSLCLTLNGQKKTICGFIVGRQIARISQEERGQFTREGASTWILDIGYVRCERRRKSLKAKLKNVLGFSVAISLALRMAIQFRPSRPSKTYPSQCTS